MVLVQGILGGLRVVLVKLDLAIVHACVAQAFFCLATFAAIVTSQWWKSAGTPSLLARNDDDLAGRRVALLGVATVVVIYLQLIVGAMMRHFDAGLAIPDLPLAYGHWLPPLNEEGLRAINHYRAFALNLDPVTLWQVWIHFAHRIGALLVTGFVLSFAIVILRRHRRAGLAGAAAALLLLLATQLTLGILTVLLRKPADVASLHVATGALVLMTSFLLTARAFRLYRPRWTMASVPMVEPNLGDGSAVGMHRPASSLVTT
jgi:cytochrome c oxidase assembly protein subunit 15